MAVIGKELFPYNLTLANEGVMDADYVNVFGYNPSVGTSEETIWAESGVTRTLPAVATAMTVSSANANDTAAGTGARTVYVYGLDGSGVPQSETVSLNGQTGVSLTKTYLRILRTYVTTAGSGGTNAGIVYVGYGSITSGKPATVQAHLRAGAASSLLGLWTVPAGRTGFLLDFHARSNGKGEFRLYAREPGEIFRVRRNVVITDSADYDYGVPLKLPALTDIEARGLADTGTNKMSTAFTLVLVP